MPDLCNSFGESVPHVSTSAAYTSRQARRVHIRSTGTASSEFNLEEHVHMPATASTEDDDVSRYLESQFSSEDTTVAMKKDMRWSTFGLGRNVVSLLYGR